jgi:large conductance mechanosensitive channel
MGFIKEFKEFAMKGNLVDMAIAFVMGGAFAKVVSGFIDGMVMPVVGMLTAGVDFKTLTYVLEPAKFDGAGNELAAEVSIKYGAFFTIVLDFVIVALVMFLVIKAMNRMKKKQAEAPAAAPEPTKEEVLLSEIRDLLRKP